MSCQGVNACHDEACGESLRATRLVRGWARRLAPQARAGSAPAGRAGGGLASLLSAGRVRRPVPSRIYQCASPVPV